MKLRNMLEDITEILNTQQDRQRQAIEPRLNELEQQINTVGNNIQQTVANSKTPPVNDQAIANQIKMTQKLWNNPKYKSMVEKQKQKELQATQNAQPTG